MAARWMDTRPRCGCRSSCNICRLRCCKGRLKWRRNRSASGQSLSTNAKAARDRWPDGLAEVVPTSRVGSLRPRRLQCSEIFVTNKLTSQPLDALHRTLYVLHGNKRCTASTAFGEQQITAFADRDLRDL